MARSVAERVRLCQAGRDGEFTDEQVLHVQQAIRDQLIEAMPARLAQAETILDEAITEEAKNRQAPVRLGLDRFARLPAETGFGETGFH